MYMRVYMLECHASFYKNIIWAFLSYTVRIHTHARSVSTRTQVSNYRTRETVSQ